ASDALRAPRISSVNAATSARSAPRRSAFAFFPIVHLEVYPTAEVRRSNEWRCLNASWPQDGNAATEARNAEDRAVRLGDYIR
ncbi:MAG: hypothetical protein COZ06_07945, partial [Armatimonadetes bacterium CG_4_10_14_3_um_filter_66_18]